MAVHPSKTVFLVNPAVRAIACNYEPEEKKTKIFKSLDAELIPGDFVVVPTDTRYKMTVCKVIDVDVEFDVESSEPVDWIVARFSREEYEKTLSDEGKMLAMVRSAEIRKKREELAKSLLADQEAIKALDIARAGQAIEPPKE